MPQVGGGECGPDEDGEKGTLAADGSRECKTPDLRGALRRVIEHAAHLLPAQGPITAFIHHNTLHAFEDLPFDKAVSHGARSFGCHPFLTEQQYHRELERGRILREDLTAALIDDLGDGADELLGFLGTRFHLRSAMLEQPFLLGPAAELRWFVAEADALRRFRPEVAENVRRRVIRETRHWIMRDLFRSRAVEAGQTESREGAQSDVVGLRRILFRLFEVFDNANIESWNDTVWESFCLHLLWRICQSGVRNLQRGEVLSRPALEQGRKSTQLRDLLLAATGADSDRLVNDVLIPFCAALVDQGFADWPLPARDKGLLAAFCELHGTGYRSPERWLRGLRDECDQIQSPGADPLDLILRSLDVLGVARDEWEAFLSETLLALRGWAGMIWQLETRGDRVAIPLPHGTLLEFVAVRLVLERLALAHVARESLDYHGPLNELRETLRSRERTHARKHDALSADQRAFLVFQLAQIRGWTPENLWRLPGQQWITLLDEIEAFSGVERRRIFHHAYERRYRVQTLDALVQHSLMRNRCAGEELECASGDRTAAVQSAPTNDAVPPRRAGVPAFQTVFCIDEREESFRRHMEEIAPDCETYGAAGFFAVAMYYRGAGDAYYVPLCPVVIRPTHYVAEEVAYTLEHSARRRRQTRRALATVTHRAHLGSRTFAGGWLAALAGSLASIPLVVRILFPRLAAQIRRFGGSFVRPPVLTRLELERLDDPPGPTAGRVGFNVEEMASIVEQLLRDIGLTENLARLVFIVGHGSSSLNNPHEAAHDCGACGGGRGGPNARALAQMANDPRVRDELARRGLSLPRGVVFIGAYHNTCDDSVAYYDLDRLPTSHRSDFERACEVIDEARQRNAHERCRRFESAELSMSAEDALRHVEARAEDLSQVRPEFGHATNALCFVGRRLWSRGLFLDRRAFLQSYDPAQDDGQYTVLARILRVVIPVCAGINLEYYFSYTDPTGYGCGTKLPHNIVSLLGVMNGAASDLLPGLPWQMVEIHEPVRLLMVVETTPAALLQIMEQHEDIGRLCRGQWLQLATIDPATAEICLFHRGVFERYRPQNGKLPVVRSSVEWYRGWRGHLGFATVRAEN